MKKYFKLPAIILLALVFSSSIFFAGYKLGSKSDAVTGEQVYIAHMEESLASLSELLSAEIFSLDDIDAILSSLEDIRMLSESAAEYTNDEEVIAQMDEFAVAVHIIYDAIGSGLAYDGELLFYGFVHDCQVDKNEAAFLVELSNDFSKSDTNTENIYSLLSQFSLKYSPEEISNIYGNRGFDKNERIIEIKQRNEEFEQSFPINYESNEIIFIPKLTVRSFSDEITAYCGTSWWTASGMTGHADSAFPNDILSRYETEMFIYEGDVIKLFFNVMPQSYTIYLLEDSGAEIATEYELFSYITMPADTNELKFLVRAEWNQGIAYYTFKIGLKEPADWSK